MYFEHSNAPVSDRGYEYCALLRAFHRMLSTPPLLQPLDSGGQQQLICNILSNIAVYRAHGIHDVLALMDQVGGGRERQQARDCHSWMIKGEQDSRGSLSLVNEGGGSVSCMH